MIDLSRYVFEALRKDEEYILYRAQSEDVAFQVLVLSPAVQRPTPESLKRLEHEYSLREALDPRWAARPNAMARHGARTVLVLEDPGGAPLDQLLGHPLDLAFSLRLAIGLSAAIGQLHQRGLIHKDIKPPNVLVNSVTGQCWLRGFGIASRLPRERQAPKPPEFIAGTLACMAPEQTGRMNRSIDSRSTSRPFDWQAKTASSRTRASRMNSRRSSISPAAMRRAPTPTFKTPATPTSAGVHLGRCGSSINAIHAFLRNELLLLPRQRSARPLSSWTSGQW